MNKIFGLCCSTLGESHPKKIEKKVIKKHKDLIFIIMNEKL
tara:strand:+ start:1724 stop:1846 length:123 start_codon:yes stop_codon:yes gene_type:complete